MEENIDILLATYNGEKYIKEQIESILNQTYKNINLIISDDCSTDNTRKILTEYTQKDKRITVYFQNENQGYISLHNPSDKEKTFSIHLNRDIGIIKKFQNFSISSPLGHDQEISKRQWNYGDILTLKIPAKSIKLLTFKE